MPEIEGVIKYRSHFVETEPYDFKSFEGLEAWRKQLYQLQLIGQYDDGIGYGNLSIRDLNNSFFITATQTGHLPNLDASHYTKVVDYNSANHTLSVVGPNMASSESATHYAIYTLSTEIKAIFHIHSSDLWQKMLKAGHLSTRPDVEYGTVEMALEIARIYQDSLHIFEQNTFVMAGHQDGIFAFGRNLDEAGEAILKLYSQFGTLP